MICPKGVQTSYQKLILWPLPRIGLTNLIASVLSFKNCFHIQESKVESFRAQRLFSWRFVCLCQLAHKEVLPENRSQINLRQSTLFHINRLLKPRPPSSFGRHTIDHETLTLLMQSVLPDQRKREHIDSIFFIHPFGRTKVVIKKLTVPYITEAINCNRPAKERAFTVHVLNL